MTRFRILRRPDWVAALLISCAAASLHFYFLTQAGGLWRDEVNTVNLATRHSVGDMASDSFPIMMPLMIRGWLAVGLGGSDMALRGLGLLIGLGILAALWLAAWVGRSAPPALSLALLGLNSTAIIYGDSLRAFGLGSLFLLLMLAAVGAFLREPSWRRAGLLAATAVLSVQALFQNAIFVGSVCIGVWVVCWRRHTPAVAAKILLVGLIAAASILPYRSKIAVMSSASPTSGISTLRTEFRPAIALGSLNSAVGFPLPQYAYAWGVLTLAVVAFAVRASRANSAASNPSSAEVQAQDLQVFAASALLIGLAGFAEFLWWAALRTQPWYFLPPMALAAATFELGLPPLRRYSYAVLGGFVALTGLLAVPLAWRAVHFRFTNVDLLAQRLAAEATPSDFVVVTPWNRGISFARYFRTETAWETVPPLEDHSTHRYDLLQRETQTKDAMRPTLERIATALQTHHRVWIVGVIDIPPTGAPVPKDLPPPPLEHTGWSAGPYVRRWTAQVTQFISNHSRQFVAVPLDSTLTINPNEDLELSVADGWEDR